MSNYDNFIQGIVEKKKVKITYFSQKDNRNTTRLCAPFDFGPKRKNEKKYGCNEYIDNGSDKYLFWDYEGSGGGHIGGKNSNEVINIELVDKSFNPNDLINLNELKCSWHIDRNWNI